MGNRYVLNNIYECHNGMGNRYVINNIYECYNGMGNRYIINNISCMKEHSQARDLRAEMNFAIGFSGTGADHHYL